LVEAEPWLIKLYLPGHSALLAMPAFTCQTPLEGIEIALPSQRAFRLYRYAPDNGEPGKQG